MVWQFTAGSWFENYSFILCGCRPGISRGMNKLITLNTTAMSRLSRLFHWSLLIAFFIVCVWWFLLVMKLGWGLSDAFWFIRHYQYVHACTVGANRCENASTAPVIYFKCRRHAATCETHLFLLQNRFCIQIEYEFNTRIYLKNYFKWAILHSKIFPYMIYRRWYL